MPDPVSCPKCSAKVPAGARFCQVCGASTAASGSPHARGAAKKSAPTKKPQWMILLAGSVVILLLAGLAIGGLSRMSAKAPAATAGTSGEHDMQAMVDMAGPMPNWLSASGKTVIAEYTWAASHHNELQYFPCYCGCFNSAGHVSNSECYFKRDGGKKILAYDQHAFG